jgi:CHAT domain-containing protein
MRKSLSFLVVFLAAAAAAAAAASSDRDDAVAVARSFYRAYAGGDLEAALSLWTAHSPAADALRRRTQRLLRTHCLALGRLEATDTDIAADAATVKVEAEWLDSGNMPGAMPTVDYGDGKVLLRREAGRWRIAGWQPSAAAFADALASGDEAARAAALRSPRIRCRAALREIARRAVTLTNQEKFEGAASLTAVAKRIAEEIGDDAALSLAISSESILRQSQRGDALAVTLAERSVALAEGAGDADALMRALLTLSRAKLDHSHERAFALRDYGSDPALIAIVASRAAQINNDDGDHWSALQFSNLCLRYAQETGDLAAMINAEMNIAATYDSYGDHSVALVHWLRVAALTGRAGFANIRTDSLLQAAGEEIELGHRIRARALIDQAAREQPKKLGILLLRARCETNRTAAARYLSEALRLAEVNHDGIVKVEALGMLARAQLDQGHPAAALPYVRQIGLLESYESPAAARFDQAALTAETERRLGHAGAALRAVQEAISVAELERATVLGNARQQRAYSAARLRIYGELVTIRAEARQPLAALAAADEAKGRTLLDLLRSRRATLDDVMTAEERQREHDLRERAAALRRRAEAASTTRAALLEQLERSRAEIDDFEAAMAAKYPRTIPSWAPPAPLDEAMLRRLLPDPSIAIVELMVTRDRLHAFVVRRDAAGRVRVRIHTTAMGSGDLRRRVTRFASALASADVDYRADARALYDLLLAPLAPQLAGVRVVCIVPDGPLWRIPFETLMAHDGRFFVERVAPFYVPSIAVYARMRDTERKRGEGMFFALADPAAGRTPGAAMSRLRAGETSPLPDAVREVRTAAQILGGRSAVYVGAAASIARIEAEAADYRVLHFATHGILDDADPMYSHLVFAPAGDDDGVLDAWRIMRMQLNAELAVLSACDTARGGDGEGEGVVGMAWALFVAGCPSTIAAQWKIASAPSADILIDFYRQRAALGDQPFAKTIALANAQRHMLRQPSRRHPFFWAPFILVGVG